jgi:hypothetical protein
MKLTRENFLYWQTQVLPSLRGARVMGLLDGFDAAPPKFLEVEDEHKKKTTVPNPAFDVWIAKDQQVVGFLVNSLSEDVLAHVFGLEHAADVWKALNDLYGSQSKSRVSSLRGAMTNTNKLDLTAQQYISKMKGFASELAAAGKKVYDEELKDYILNGLDGNFNSLVAAINAVPSTTLNDMCSQVLACEHRDNMLQSTGEAPGSFTSSVNAAPRRPSFDTHSVPARPPLLPPLPNTPPCTTTLRSLCIHPIIPISICPCLSITCHNHNNLWCLNLPTCLHHTPTSLHSSSIARPCHHLFTNSPCTARHSNLTSNHVGRVAVLKGGVVRRTELPLNGRRVSCVKFAKRKATLQMSVGGVLAMMMMRMTRPRSARVPMVWTQIGS